MKTLMLYVTIFATCCAPVHAMKQINGDFTLTPPPPKRPAVFGFSIGDSPAEIMSSVQAAHLDIQHLEREGKDARVILAGLPQDLNVAKGETVLIFEDNKLTHMEFEVEPSYHNFLLLRDRMGRSLGERFTLSGQKEHMDRYLRSHLSHLKDNEYNRETEKAIASAMARGSTFFFYRFKDKFEQLDVRLSYRQSPDARRPRLHITFSDLAALDRQREEKLKKLEDGGSSILPNR